MATTIPALTSVDDILDTDLVMVTHSNGQSYKIPGTALNKRNQVVISANTTLTGTPLKTGNVVRAYFTADLVANNSSTPLTLSYNSVSYTVKVPKNGALANFLPFDVGGGVYKYLQAYTTLELIFDGTYFVVLGNPVVLSSADYTIYPDGSITYTKTKIDGNYTKKLTLVGTFKDLYTPATFKINVATESCVHIKAYVFNELNNIVCEIDMYAKEGVAQIIKNSNYDYQIAGNDIYLTSINSTGYTKIYEVEILYGAVTAMNFV
jgi:hypothetical protein